MKMVPLGKILQRLPVVIHIASGFHHFYEVTIPHKQVLLWKEQCSVPDASGEWRPPSRAWQV
jgi:hypothetical protein